MSENPYATSESAIAVPPLVYEGAEAMRQYHIKHEASVKTVGALYILGAIFAVIGAFSLVVPALSSGQNAAFSMGVATFYGLMGVFVFFVGREVRRLTPWARIVGIVFAAIGLLGFPIGTLINAYILWLFASKKGAYVFSPEYKQIIAETPHIKYRSKVLLIILIVVLVIIAVFALAGLWASRSTAHP